MIVLDVFIIGPFLLEQQAHGHRVAGLDCPKGGGYMVAGYASELG